MTSQRIWPDRSRAEGDIRIERGDTRIYFPITSMIVVSLLLSLIASIFFRR